MYTELTIPSHFNPANAGSWSYRPDENSLMVSAFAWAKQHGLHPSAIDKAIIHLLVIDAQKDFCFPEGTLYVGGRSGTGAIDDNRRLAEFMYRNLGLITNTTFTMDTHFAFQIFSPTFWTNEKGEMLSGHSMIRFDGNVLVNTKPTGEILHTNVRPNPALASWICGGNYPWMANQARFYVKELERVGKYVLYLWPMHCILGTDGHALAGVIEEARFFHSVTRLSQPHVEIKGGNLLTENYSVLCPEVLMRHDGKPLAERNKEFIKKLMQSDAVIIAGQAASHCVKSTIEDLLGDDIITQDPKLARKVYILEDCTSAVAVPDGKGGFVADFTPQAEEAMRKFANVGMNLVKSTDSISSWPGIRL